MCQLPSMTTWMCKLASSAIAAAAELKLSQNKYGQVCRARHSRCLINDTKKISSLKLWQEGSWTMSSLMESHLIASINEHLSLHLTQNSIFLAERLVAQFPSETNLLLLATCYHRSGETFRAYHLLKGALVMVFSSVFCNVAATIMLRSNTIS